MSAWDPNHRFPAPRSCSLKLHETCPLVNFHLEEREALDTIAYLLRNDGEWGLTTLDGELSLITDSRFWQDYEILCLRQDHFKVLTTVSSPLVQFQSVSDKQLLQYPLITYATSAEQPPLVSQLLEREGLQPKWFLMSNSQSVFSESIIKKSAIALSSDLIIKSATRKNEDRMLLLPMTRKIPLVQVIVKKKTLSPAGQLFHDYILETLSLYGIDPKPYSRSDAH